MYEESRVKPYKVRLHAPPISVYLIADSNVNTLEEVHCMWCGRCIADAKGQIITVITTPVSIQDFDVAINARCKLCKQDYRFLI